MDEMVIKEYEDVLKKVHSEWKALPESRKKEKLFQLFQMMLNVQTKLHVYDHSNTKHQRWLFQNTVS